MIYQSLQPEININYVIALVLTIFGLAVLFFILTFLSRLVNIRNSTKKELFQEEINQLLFAYLFENKTIEEIKSAPSFKKNFKKSTYKQLLIKSIVSLYHSYSGEYVQRLENFYEASRLVDYSLHKLNSINWSHKVEAIRDLSSLKYQPAYKQILQLKQHPNPHIQQEVLLGLIKLQGVEQLANYIDSKMYINQWIQANILHIVQKNNLEAPDNLLDLLKSKNVSLVRVCVLLIEHFKKENHYQALSSFYYQCEDIKLKSDIGNIVKLVNL